MVMIGKSRPQILRNLLRGLTGELPQVAVDLDGQLADARLVAAGIFLEHVAK